MSDLQDQLLADRQASYVRLRGGFPIPMAGTVYWLAIAAGSQFLEPATLLFYAFIGTGAIFPLALLFAAVFRNPFMKDKTATGSVLFPAFVSMLLFWPMLAVAASEGSADVVLVILAIGMSIHWPVIGWSYGRTALFCAHSIIRALLVVGLWFVFPEQRFLLVPLAVAGVYAATIIAIFIDSGRLKAQGAPA